MRTIERVQDGFAFPIIEQIKQEEALNLAELKRMIEVGGGFPLECGTDCIRYLYVPRQVGEKWTRESEILARD